MKNIYTKICLSCLVAMVFLLTACDKDASNRQMDMGVLGFSDDVTLSLYTPDYEVENDSLCKDKNLCTTVMNIPLGVFMISDNQTIISVGVEQAIPFELPFLTEDGEVRGIFRQGILARIYYRLKNAAEAGKMDAGRFAAFQNEIRVIKDTLVVEGMTSDFFDVKSVGASIVSWDKNLHSNYVKLNLLPMEFSRGSNLYGALVGIRDILEEGMATGLLTQEDVEDLMAIRELKSGTMEDGMGWMTLQMINYHLSFELHLENASGVLDVLAKALYGKSSDKQVWLVVKADSNIDSANDYKEIE